MSKTSCGRLFRKQLARQSQLGDHSTSINSFITRELLSCRASVPLVTPRYLNQTVEHAVIVLWALAV